MVGRVATSVQTLPIASDTLGDDVSVFVADHGPDSPTVWLLHGRCAPADEVEEAVAGVSSAMSAGSLRPMTLIAPNDPHPERSSWWVDSPAPGGAAVETAMLRDVFPQVEERTGGSRSRRDRIVAGYSMGGAGAMRWSLVHVDLFAGAALISPAAFAVLPIESSVQSSGVFATAESRFDERNWRPLLHYPTLLDEMPANARQRFAIVVSDGEPVQDYPFGRSSLTQESARLHVALTDDPRTETHLRVLPGAHVREFWAPALTEALRVLG